MEPNKIVTNRKLISSVSMGKDNTGLKFYGNIGFESNIQVSEVIEHQIIQKVAISETMFLVFFEQLLQQTCM